MKPSAVHRAAADRLSSAPRLLGAQAFAIRTDVDPQAFRRWRIYGPVWVPSPDAVVGEPERPGWSSECADLWTPGVQPWVRAKPVAYLDTSQMLRLHRVSYLGLWAGIAAARIAAPAVWVDDKPGWLPAPKSSQ